MKNDDYSKLISRNYAYICPALQNTIKKTTLVFAGCGLASVIAEAAVRLGFTRFVLIDYDKVELSNLNRQNFYRDDIKKFKVDALANKLLNINPNSKIKKIYKKITIKNIIHIIRSGNIIINTIDYGQAYDKLVSQSMQHKKLIICPFNPSFAGLAVCFNENSGSLADLLKTNQLLLGLEFSKKLRQNNSPEKFPKHFNDELKNILPDIEKKGFNPQLVIGAQITTGIVMSCIVKYLNEEKIPLSPAVIYRDLYFYDNIDVFN